MERLKCDLIHDWKNYNDQTCRCPRDWRLLTSWVPIKSPLYVELYSTIILRDFKETLNWAPIMSSGLSLSDRRGKKLNVHESRAFARWFCLWEASSKITWYQIIHKSRAFARWCYLWDAAINTKFSGILWFACTKLNSCTKFTSLRIFI